MKWSYIDKADSNSKRQKNNAHCFINQKHHEKIFFDNAGIMKNLPQNKIMRKK